MHIIIQITALQTFTGFFLQLKIYCFKEVTASFDWAENLSALYCIRFVPNLSKLFKFQWCSDRVCAADVTACLIRILFFVSQGAVIGIDDEDDSTFTITVDQKTFHFQGELKEEIVFSYNRFHLYLMDDFKCLATEQHEWAHWEHSGSRGAAG